MSQEGYVKLYNGFDFPLLGMGTYSPNPKEPWVEAVKDAIDIGYRHFDCASYYGNEKLIGKAIKEKIAEGVIKREDIFVTSKLWNNKHERDSVLPALKKTLAHLELEYINLYLIHWPFSVPDIPGQGIPRNENGQVLTTDIDYKVTWRGMEDCLEKGLAQSIGLCNFNLSQVKDIVKNCKISPAVLQIESHPYLTQNELINYCKSVKIVVTAFCPLGRPVSSFRGREIIADPVLLALAKKYERTPAQVALRFQLDRGVGVIPKSTNRSRLEENYDILQFHISQKDVIVLECLNKDERYVKCLDYAHHRYYPFQDDQKM